ncbi:MAG: hypothetical protein HW387_754 [Parachlamydiales bacterium]|nr:hypothetical protein [Parachlamydiales bacterium]
MLNVVSCRLLSGGCFLSVVLQRRFCSMETGIVSVAKYALQTLSNDLTGTTKKLPSLYVGECKSCATGFEGTIPDLDSPDYPEWERVCLETVEGIERVLERNRLAGETKKCD